MRLFDFPDELRPLVLFGGIALMLWVVLKVYKIVRSSNQSFFVENDIVFDNPTAEHKNNDALRPQKPYITKNIYGAVETFATLCHMWKKNTGWLYEDADYAWISVTYNNDDVCLEMECRGDCMARQVPVTFPELRAESDNIAVYKSNEVHSLDPNNPRALWEAYKAGSPNAVLQSMSATSGSVFIQIKFNN